MTTETTALSPEEFDELDAILDDLRTRGEDVPQWEFCEGVMAALLCTRRPVPVDEYLPLVLGIAAGPAGQPGEEGEAWFADEAQRSRFMTLWQRREAEVAQALSLDVETLEDERTYHPEVMDLRGAVAMLPDAERAEMASQELPAFGQVWALGFMFVVENWAEEWELPRDRDTAAWIDEALATLVALTEDDTAAPSFNMHHEEGPPSVSDERANAFGAAIWAVYDLHRIWHSLGPRVAPARKTGEPGRNDPCWCGSGKKFKKCHGA
ncbi:MAG: uncharacterized protein PWQ61_1340 [Betaproteobacteria bacterium]|nr:uncharacterized protein [Betaproteobacteria bacterium]